MSKRPLNAAEKFLSLLTEVKAGEGAPTLLMGLSIFLLMTSYYMMKAVREGLILSSSGAEIKSYAAALQLGVLLVAIPFYGKIIQRFSRLQTINIITLFFILCMVLFYFLARAHFGFLGVIFFIWVGVFNMMVIAQFWSYANDIHSPAQGKRLFAIIACGANLGAMLGSFLVGQLIMLVGVNQLLLVAAVFLVLSLTITNLIETRKFHIRGDVVKPPSVDFDRRQARPLTDVFRMVTRNRYVLFIALMLLLLNCVNSTGEYILGKMISGQAKALAAAGSLAAADIGQYIGKFYADFHLVVNLITMLIQLFFVSRIFKHFGVGIAVLFLPLLAFGSYAVIVAYPVLAVVRWMKIFENATDYSLQNTTRHALFLPTRINDKYVAKQATDGIFWRLGDVMSALLVAYGTMLMGWGIQQFALVNATLVIAWLLVSRFLGREFVERTKQDTAMSEAIIDAEQPAPSI